MPEYDVNYFKLGKTAPEYDPNVPELRAYMTPAGAAPYQCHYGHGMSFNMDGNDSVGDCVIAEFQHQDVIWCGKSGKPSLTEPSQCIPTYSTLTGYVPGNASTDKGTSMLAANKYWVSNGMGGVKIDTFVTVNAQEQTEVETSVYQFGGMSTGLAMPLSAQSQTFNQAWTVTSTNNAPGSWGGHCVVICGYDEKYLYCVTWGRLQAMTWGFLTTYCDEAYAMLSRDWMTSGNVAPNGFAWARLEADLATV